ncbi:MAG: HD domain-containing phosphohydrolase [Pirellulales bacterium]
MPVVDSGIAQGEAALAAAAVWNALGAELSILDAQSGRVLVAAPNQPNADPVLVSRLALQAFRSRHTRIRETDGPIAWAALPLMEDNTARFVAAGPILVRAIRDEEDLALLAVLLDIDPDDARRWAARQTPWGTESLRRMGQMLSVKWQADCRIKDLESEVTRLSENMALTFDEVSLIFRLTQNLRLSRTAEDLARMAVDWLGDVLPVEGIAVQLHGEKPARDSNHDEIESPLLTAMRCSVASEVFSKLLARLRPSDEGSPVVYQGDKSAAIRNVRSYVACPLGDGGRNAGWLVAVNHRGDGFSPVEIDLMTSVAAILGIHANNSQLYHQQAELLSGIVRALTSAIDAKDPYTCGHSDRVARVSVRLARELGCAEELLETVYLSGLLHDVGKIGIDDQVLRKPGRLTEAEFEHIKNHSRIGHNILVDLKQLGPVLPAVLHHHEAWDGSGYPSKLAGDDIPLLARIVAVADAFDAMGSDRPYRKGMGDDKLDIVLREGAGKQWDAEVVAAFFRARDDIRQISRPSEDHSQIPQFT